MPNPAFMPVIGSSFDADAAQQAGWARFNVGVEESNMQRAAQAQAERNSYFARLAQMQEQAAARADATDTAATNLSIARGDQARQEKESRRRFDIGTDLTKEQQALERTHWDFDINREKNARERQLSQAENYAKTKADEVNDIGTRHDTALDTYRTAQTAAQTAISSIETGHPLVKYDSRKKEFVKRAVPPDVLKDEAAAAEYNKTAASQIEAANAAREEAQAAFAKATTDYGSAREDWNSLQKELSSYNLTPKKLGKLWGVYSPNHDKTWTPTVKESVSAAAPAGYNPVMRMGTSEGYEPGNEPPPQPVFDRFAPPTTDTGTTPPPVALPSAAAPPFSRSTPGNNPALTGMVILSIPPDPKDRIIGAKYKSPKTGKVAEWTAQGWLVE